MRKVCRMLVPRVMLMLVHGTCPVLHAILLGRRQMKVSVMVRVCVKGYMSEQFDQVASATTKTR